MSLLILRRDADGRKRPITPRGGLDRVDDRITHITDDGAQVVVTIEKPFLRLRVPLLDLLLRHPFFLRLRENTVVLIPLVAVLFVELIDQGIVLLDKFLDILDELVLILCDIDRRRRSPRCLFEGIGDTAHLELIVLQVVVVAPVDLDVRVCARRHHRGGCRTARRKRHGCADGAAAHDTELQIVQKGCRVPCRGARRIDSEVDLVAVPRLAVGKGEALRYRVVVCADIERGLLAVRAGIARVVDAIR